MVTQDVFGRQREMVPLSPQMCCPTNATYYSATMCAAGSCKFKFRRSVTNKITWVVLGGETVPFWLKLLATRSENLLLVSQRLSVV